MLWESWAKEVAKAPCFRPVLSDQVGHQASVAKLAFLVVAKQGEILFHFERRQPG